MVQRITAYGVSNWGGKMIDFKGVHYPKAVILHAVFFYVRYAVSYCDLEEILAERGGEWTKHGGHLRRCGTC